MKYGAGIFSNSRRAWILLAIFAFASGITTRTLIKAYQPNEPDKNKIIVAKHSAKNSVADIDTDHDGLKDWEENLYHTDPKNPDTDGDGTSDGEEIRRGRNPLKRGPKDFLTTTTPDLLTNSTEKNLTTRLASRIGQELIIPYFRDPTERPNIEKIAGQIINATIRDVSKPRLLTTADLHIENTTDHRSTTHFIEELNSIITESLHGIKTGTELTLFTTAITENNFSKLNGLDSFIAAYEKLIAGGKKLLVPSDLASTYRAFLNSLILEKTALTTMKTAETDPIGSLSATKDFISAHNDMSQTAEKLFQSYTTYTRSFP